MILLMGVTRLRDAAAQLIHSGHDTATPVALVENGFAADQRVTVGTLKTIADRAEAIDAKPPAVTIIGDVVTLSPSWIPV